MVYFDAQYRRIYLNSSIKLNGESFLKHLFSNPIKYQDDKMFRVSQMYSDSDYLMLVQGFLKEKTFHINHTMGVVYKMVWIY